MKHADELIEALAAAAEMKLALGLPLVDIVADVLQRGEAERLRTAEVDHGTMEGVYFHRRLREELCGTCEVRRQLDYAENREIYLQRGRRADKNNYYRRKIEGLCECGREPLPEQVRCSSCAERVRLLHRAKRLDRRKRGLCTECESNELETKTLCARHARAKRASNRR